MLQTSEDSCFMSSYVTLTHVMILITWIIEEFFNFIFQHVPRNTSGVAECGSQGGLTPIFGEMTHTTNICQWLT